MSEPTTEAGRSLNAYQLDASTSPFSQDALLNYILAIEAEAAQPADSLDVPSITDDPDYFPNTDYERGYADGRLATQPVVHVVHEAIALLNSMVHSGEQHTIESRAIVDRARAALKVGR